MKFKDFSTETLYSLMQHYRKQIDYPDLCGNNEKLMATISLYNEICDELLKRGEFDD